MAGRGLGKSNGGDRAIERLLSIIGDIQYASKLDAKAQPIFYQETADSLSKKLAAANTLKVTFQMQMQKCYNSAKGSNPTAATTDCGPALRNAQGR
jgi:hypothetical protein